MELQKRAQTMILESKNDPISSEHHVENNGFFAFELQRV